MIEEKVKKGYSSHEPLMKSSTSEYKYFSINQNGKPFSLPLWISEKQLQQLIDIQKQIKAEFGIKKSLIDIASIALKIALEETIKTCSIEGGV